MDSAESTLTEHDGTAPAALQADLDAEIAGGQDLRLLLQRLLDPIVRLAGAQAGAVRVLAGGGERLALAGDFGLPAPACGPQADVDRHCGHCGAALDTRQPVWASELGGCAERSPGGYFGQHCQRMLALPLQYRGRVLGVCKLFFASACSAPGPEVMALLESAGELLGLTLDNARLEREKLRASLLEERQRLAAELHDSIAQLLAFAKMRMPLLHDALLAHDDPQALRYYADVRSAVSEAHSGLRQILSHSRMPMDPLGLRHALQDAAANFQRQSGITLALDNEIPDLQLAPEHASQVFHVAQEALANITKHAMAQHAWLTLRRMHDRIELRVDDDGGGLQPAAAAAGPDHLGLGIMGERARRLGGSIEVGARPGGGTSVRLSFPAAVNRSGVPA